MVPRSRKESAGPAIASFHFSFTRIKSPVCVCGLLPHGVLARGMDVGVLKRRRRKFAPPTGGRAGFFAAGRDWKEACRRFRKCTKSYISLARFRTEPQVINLTREGMFGALLGIHVRSGK